MRLFQGKGRTALLGVIGLLALLVTACGSGGGSSSSTAQGPYDFTYNPTAPSGSATGTIIFGEYQAPNTLNPLLFGAEVEAKNVNLLWDSCLVQLPDLSKGPAGFLPDQCTETPTTANNDESADGKTTTVKLDPNAKWSDGQSITALDYLFSYDIYQDPNVLGSPYPFNLIKSFTVVDPHTIKISWSVPFAGYLVAIPQPLPVHSYPKAFNATTRAYSSTVIQGLFNDPTFNHTFASDNGPYTVKSFSPDTIVYTKNPNFHSNFFKGPYANTIIFKSTGDVNTSIEDFKTGGLDQADDYKYSDTASFTGIPQSQQVTSPLISYDFLGFNQRPQALNANDPNNPTATVDANGNVTKPGVSVFANPMFRKAIFEAIDVCAGIVTIQGDANCHDPAIYATELTAAPAYDADTTFTPTPYNVSQAQADLASAGFANCKYTEKDGSHKKITLNVSTTNGNPARAAYLSLVDSDLSKLGCNISLSTYVAVPNYFGAISQGGIIETGKFDISLHGFVNGTEPITNSSLFDSTYIPGQPNNPAGIGGDEDGIKDSMIEGQINQGAQTLDFTTRKPIYQAIQREVIQNWYVLPLYLDPNVTLVAPTLHNYKLDPGSVGNTWNIADWWSSGNRSSQ